MAARRAFTLIEVLIGLSIFSIVALSIYHTLYVGRMVYATGDRIIEEQSVLRDALSIIASDLTAAVAFSGKDEDWKRSTWKSGELSFTKRAAGKPPLESSSLRRISYTYDDIHYDLVRIEASYEKDTESWKEETTVVLTGVEVSFSYWVKTGEGSEWRQSDLEDVLPFGVKIAIAKRLGEQASAREIEAVSFEKVVYIPAGKTIES